MIYSYMISIYVTIWKNNHYLNVQWLTKKKLSDSFKDCKKITQRFRYLKLLKDQKILKNQMIFYLEIIETKQNIYD